MGSEGSNGLALPILGTIAYGILDVFCIFFVFCESLDFLEVQY